MENAHGEKAMDKWRQRVHAVRAKAHQFKVTWDGLGAHPVASFVGCWLVVARVTSAITPYLQDVVYWPLLWLGAAVVFIGYGYPLVLAPETARGHQAGWFILFQMAQYGIPAILGNWEGGARVLGGWWDRIGRIVLRVCRVVGGWWNGGDRLGGGW